MERERVPVLCVLLLAGFALQGNLRCFAAGPENRSEEIRCGDSEPMCARGLPGYDEFYIFEPPEVCLRETPWQVSLSRDCIYRCSGVVIDDQHVLTAAHCLIPPPDTIVVGEFYLTRSYDGQQVHIEGYEWHDRYKTGIPAINDIGIIRLTKKLEWNISSEFNSVNRICLPNSAEAYEIGSSFKVSGWGRSVNYPHRDIIPRSAEVQLKPSTFCFDKHNSTLICAMDVGNNYAKGDSGNPLYRKMLDGRVELIGLTTGGDNKNYSVYIRVSEHTDWIDKMIKEPKLKFTLAL